MNIIELEKTNEERIKHWRNFISESPDKFLHAQPFPFVVLDDFLPAQQALSISQNFPTAHTKSWTSYLHVNEQKYGLNKREFIPHSILELIDALNGNEFIEVLSSVTGIAGLIADEQLAGGGLHQMQQGGYLNIHSDFLIHPIKKNLLRKINLIIFLSDDWQSSYGGELEFWDKEMKYCVQCIQPRFNRCVIFQTDEFSYHGCPERLNGPKEFLRNTLALYYYTEYVNEPVKQYTDYKARPSDKNKIAIYLDNKAVAYYSWLKQKLKLNDDLVSKVLRYFKF